LSHVSRRERTAFRHIESDALRLLQALPWPGNVRELQNIVERATVLEVSRASSAPRPSSRGCARGWERAAAGGLAHAEALAGKPLADIEKQVILSTLQQFNGHRIRTPARSARRAHTGHEAQTWKEDGELGEAHAYLVHDAHDEPTE